MADFLVFQLQGVMASWGDIAVGEHRPSQGHPSKSAVLGLLAAALGIERQDDELHIRLDKQLGFAVCVRAAGELLRDYHTIQVPAGKRDYASRRDELLTDKLNLKTILSQRDYRMDAFYQVAIWCKQNNANFTLDELQVALKQPKYTLYLGRKSCPVNLPLNPVVLSDMNLKQVFDSYSLNNSQSLVDDFNNNALNSYYWEQGMLNDNEIGMTHSMSYPRRDQISSRKRWQFANRDEFYYAEATREG